MNDILQGVLDPRSMCGVKECTQRAMHLIAWPMRLPVPMCTAHWSTIHEQVVTPGLPMSPRKWFEYAKENLK